MTVSAVRQIDKLSKEEQKQLIKNPRPIVRKYFRDDKGEPLELQDWQVRIVKAIVLKTPKRYGVKAVTRGGKTLAVAIGVILRCMFKSGERVQLLAPRGKQSKELMRYITGNLSHHPDVVNSLADPRKGDSSDRLKRELSSDRITFKNNSEIEMDTANINQGGQNLQGAGGTIVVVDEIEQIPKTIIRNQITRMLGESSDAQFICMTNPVTQGYMYDRMKDIERREELKDKERELNDDEKEILRQLRQEDWVIDTFDWRVAVESGRLSKQFIDEQRRILSEYEFQIWYEAEYPENVEDGLISSERVQEAVKRSWDLYQGEKIWSLDVAGEGQDLNVLIGAIVFKHPKRGYCLRIFNIESWSQGDVMETADMVDRRIGDQAAINVDALGIGKGVADRLRQRGHAVRQVKFSRKPTVQEDRFDNFKAQLFFKLKERIDEGTISIPDHADLVDQVKRMKIETSERSGKTKVYNADNENGDNSPDFADALAILMSGSDSIGTVSATAGI